MQVMLMENMDEQERARFLDDVYRTPEEWQEHAQSQRTYGISLVSEIGEVG
jgi:hypothetical protein